MGIFNSWIFFIVIYLISSVVYNQFFKILTDGMKKDGALMVLTNGLAGIFCLALIPFFEWKISFDVMVYLLLSLAIIFYTINDRLETIVMSGVEASTFTIINQLTTAFMIVLGLVVLREPFIPSKILGSSLIIGSNVLIFYKKGEFKLDRYVVLGILANLTYTIAMFIDVNNADKLNLPFYVSLCLLVPAIVVFFMERLKWSDVKTEFDRAKKGPLCAVMITYCLFILSSIRAYQLGEVTVVAPLISLTVIANVVVGFIFFKERGSLVKRIIASILIVIGVILIK